MSKGRKFLILILFLCPLLVHAAETPIPDPPTRWVTDTAGFMSPAAADQLNSRLQAYEQQTGHQFIVWIGSTTGGVPIEDWAVRAFEKWKIGRKGIDDGLALIVMAQDRKLRIEVGYGLEGDIPDAIAFRVIDETITPGIRADPSGAITAGMEQLADAIGMPLPGSATRSRPPPGRNTREPLTLLQLIFFGIIGLIFLAVLATNPSLAIWLLANILAGSRNRGGGWGGGGGSWGGGGGFGGGGGRSGGGGASGSW